MTRYQTTSASRPALLPSLLALSLVLAVAVSSCSGSTTTTVSKHRLPGLTLESLSGARPLALDSLGRDRPSVVNLWATWCTPCRIEIPVLDGASKRLAGKVDFIGVNVGDAPDAARKFIAELAVTYPQYRDGDSAMSDGLGVTGLPVTLLIDRRGIVVARLTGRLDTSRLDRALSDSLGVTP